MRTPTGQMAFILRDLALWLVAAGYGWSAISRGLAMAGFDGYDWFAAPGRWQAVTVALLVLELAAVAGLARGRGWGVAAFALAAAGQIGLAVLGRGWLRTVPAPFDTMEPQAAALTGAPLWHLAALALVTLVLLSARARRRARQGDI